MRGDTCGLCGYRGLQLQVGDIKGSKGFRAAGLSDLSTFSALLSSVVLGGIGCLL